MLLQNCNCHHHHHHHHISVMELGHLLTRFGLTYPEVSSLTATVYQSTLHDIPEHLYLQEA